RGRLDPERDDRHFVQELAEVGVALPLLLTELASTATSTAASATLVTEQPCGVVLDAQDVAALELLAVRQRVAAFVELEPQEVRRRHELRLPRLANEPIHARGGLFARIVVVGTRDGADARAVGRRVLWSLPAFSPANELQVPVFELAAVAFADGRAVGLHRALDEEPVADEPGVVALFAPEAQAGGPVEDDLFALVEDVLLELLPVVVAPGDDVFHEGVEVGLGSRSRRQAD